MNQLLAESGMRHHPVNPMTDSYLPRLVEAQSTGRCGVVSAHVFEQGVDAVRQGWLAYSKRATATRCLMR